MSFFINTHDGYYSLTNAGSIALAVIIGLLIVALALIKRSKSTDIEKEDSSSKEKTAFSTKQLVFSGISLAVAFALSYVKLIPMPWGGSVTLCSMLFITLIGYWYGPKLGIIAAFSYSLLQFVQDGGTYILSIPQALFDYILAFAALGLSGLFFKKKNGLIIGYVFAIFMRGVFASIAGYLYWMDYMPDNFPKSLAAIYPIAYNYAYILAEGAITVVLLLLPPVKNAMIRVKKQAIN